MTTALQRVENYLGSAEQALVADVEAAWAELKPAIIALGKTIGGQILTAAETYVTSGGNFADALAVVVAQLPGDAKSLESVIAGALSAQVAKLSAAPPPPTVVS